MHIEVFLHTLLSSVMHLKRLRLLTALVSGLLRDKKLSVTELGRSLSSAAKEKNNIKRSDRFLNNKHLWKERFSIYRMIAVNLVSVTPKPLIIVDWSHIPNTTCYLLRAAVVAGGRALTLYEEVFPKRLENNPNVQRRFLKKLQKMVPDYCVPVLITDAGFGKSWFKSVAALGWDYVGRVRGITTYRLEKTAWQSYKNSGARATSTPVYLGLGELTQKESLLTHFYLIKIPKKYRVSLNKLNKKSHYKSDIEYSKSANEPWLLVSSLKKMPKTIIKMYSFRMEIEEGFRDLKSSAYGFSFEKAHSTKIRRIQILLMIAMLASFIAFFTGVIAEKNKWHYQFQANTYKHKRVISLFFLGCRVINKNFNIGWKELMNVIIEIQYLINSIAWSEEIL